MTENDDELSAQRERPPKSMRISVAMRMSDTSRPKMMSSIKVGPRKKYYALDALRQGRFDFDKGV